MFRSEISVLGKKGQNLLYVQLFPWILKINYLEACRVKYSTSTSSRSFWWLPKNSVWENEISFTQNNGHFSSAK